MSTLKNIWKERAAQRAVTPAATAPESAPLLGLAEYRNILTESIKLKFPHADFGPGTNFNKLVSALVKAQGDAVAQAEAVVDIITGRLK